MKIEVTAAMLMNAIGFVAINERAVDDVTGFIDQVFIKVSNNKMQLTRYGLSIQKHSNLIECESSEDELLFQVQYDTLRDVITNISKRFENCSLTLKSKTALVIQAGRVKTELKVTNLNPPEDDPETLDRNLVLDAEELQRIIKVAKIAAARQDVRYYLNGICLCSDEQGTLRAIGTDGHRLSIAKTSYVSTTLQENSIILSNDAITYIEDILKLANSGDIGIEFNSASLAIQLPNGASLTTKIIDGKYPDWRRVVPMKTENNIMLRREELLESLRSALPMTPAKFHIGKLSLKDNFCGIKAKNDIGEYEDEVEAAGEDITTIDIGFNFDYVIAALQVIKSENVIFGFNDGKTATTMLDAENQQGVQVLMPVRI
ncbi:DNA polymerase III subunit beta [Vibrio thalassae]|uniref:Beta sliding clamp n=1 Tax=Vibrio thalassae TaxID=1243014 RepID=A0A240EIT2_9VIBR|nr:DNA polymerase III subunit beta [Vibrio thalassae]SNX47875.1 DNA polymerase III subunit beta [Vibrio thalassae]